MDTLGVPRPLGLSKILYYDDASYKIRVAGLFLDDSGASCLSSNPASTTKWLHMASATSSVGKVRCIHSPCALTDGYTNANIASRAALCSNFPIPNTDITLSISYANNAPNMDPGQTRLLLINTAQTLCTKPGRLEFPWDEDFVQRNMYVTPVIW